MSMRGMMMDRHTAQRFLEAAERDYEALVTAYTDSILESIRAEEQLPSVVDEYRVKLLAARQILLMAREARWTDVKGHG
jgi:hypothetical protein